MLGHDASFGYINAIKYAEQSTLLDKKTGIVSKNKINWMLLVNLWTLHIFKI